MARLASPEPSQRCDAATSILENLRAVLNARVGQSESAPAFGIIASSDIVHELPDAAQLMRRSIRDAIALYEPRLANVRVQAVPSEDPLRLVFEIIASLQLPGRGRGTQLVRIKTRVHGDGRVDVE